MAVALLGSDKTAFTSYSFGNIVAGSSSATKLLFVSATGPVTGVAFGLSSVAGNSGYNFAEIASGAGFTASGSGISGTAVAGSGGIAGSDTLSYKISAIDAAAWESDIANSAIYTPSMTSGTNTYTVGIAWDAVSGAATYGLYLSIDGGTTYKQVTTTANLRYSDTSGTATATDPKASGTSAYRPSGTWVSGTNTLALRTMTSGTIASVFVKEVVVSGTTATGNPRQHYVYAVYTS